MNGSRAGSSVLRAGGHPVHRVRRVVVTNEDEEQARRPRSLSRTEIFESYVLLATGMHRTFMTSRGDWVLVGCTCGWYDANMSGGRVKAEVDSKQHVLAKAQEMFDKFETQEQPMLGSAEAG